MNRSFMGVHLPVIVMAAVIVALSSIPSLRMPGLGFTLQDKVFHFLEFCLFGFLLFRSAQALIRKPAPALSIACFAGMLFAASDEWHQSFVTGREGDFADFLADAAGLIAALIVWRIVSAFKRRKA